MCNNTCYPHITPLQTPPPAHHNLNTPHAYTAPTRFPKTERFFNNGFLLLANHVHYIRITSMFHPSSTWQSKALQTSVQILLRARFNVDYTRYIQVHWLFGSLRYFQLKRPSFRNSAIDRFCGAAVAVWLSVSSSLELVVAGRRVASASIPSPASKWSPLRFLKTQTVLESPP